MKTAAAATALLAALAGETGAADYPTRPVRLVIPFVPGGSNDIVGRVVAQQLSERLGKPVVIDNRGGAGGTIGTETVVRSQPDGHTLLVISVAHPINPALYKKLPYDPIKSIAPVVLIGSGPNGLTVTPGLPANSIKELVALAKAKPGQLNYASPGVGTLGHLSCELFRVMAGIQITHVPFKGGGAAVLDVMSGHTQINIGTLVQGLPLIRAGKLKILGVGSLKRSPAVPDVPTIAESGVPGYEAANWWGIVGPAGLPSAIIKRLHGETMAILKTPEMQKWFATEGAETADMTTEQFAKYIATESVKWLRVAKEAGLKPE
jgi:tripartite-type tricarboxylate transporter receptor subunit TctC